MTPSDATAAAGSSHSRAVCQTYVRRSACGCLTTVTELADESWYVSDMRPHLELTLDDDEVDFLEAMAAELNATTGSRWTPDTLAASMLAEVLRDTMADEQATVH